MTELLCPICGKPTPEDRDTCSHCQAPLEGKVPPTPVNGEKLPDWLLDLQASETTIPDEPSPTEDAESLETELPDWLSEAILSEEDAATPEKPAEPAAREEAPAWLDNLLSAAHKPEPPAEVVPDWLAEAAAAGTPDAFLQEEISPPDEQATPPQEPVRLPEEPVASKEGGETPIGEEELPDWLIRLQGESTEKPTASVPAFIFDEETSEEETPAEEDRPLSTLPDWVSQITAEKPEEQDIEPESGLAPAELPGWLEAMRPLESAPPTAPLEDLTTAETVASGPLIGLRGVLSAEPDVIRARKPTAHALKLRVTDDQRARLALLEELLAGEQRLKPLPHLPTAAPQYLFRIVIAFALLLPILWVVINQSNIARLPEGEAQPAVMQFDTAIRRLNEGDPVLIAVDYEAGFTGEMDLVANVLLSRLVEQGAYLVLASTNTAGPALSQRLLTSLDDTLGSHYADAANLGYLPGGALGLAGLLQSPRQLLPYTLDDSDPWVITPLSEVNILADFSMVIVIANDADTARIWIEQTSKDLQAGNVPLLLVVSAQAEPLVRPYAEGDAPQVKALLAGLPDSAAYENLATRYSPGRHEIWDAFSLILPIAALVIIIGSLGGAVITAIKEEQAQAKSKPKPRQKTERR
uniref:Uncharacterized protein n=1 Tax=uncultured Chloroflexota bacterium TaxID=166587 RepID=Q2Z024_9CHLR|nr:hypothetical protein [uncultured Chloroflexota bacterium]